MRVMVVSDTHGRVSPDRWLERWGRAFGEEPQAVIHCGDGYAQAAELRYLCKAPFFQVPGNCDDAWAPRALVAAVGGQQLLVVHGDAHGVKRDLGVLAAVARQAGAAVACFGHTHQRCWTELGGIWLFNPGSAWEPRDGKAPSLGVLELGGEAPQAGWLDF